MDVHIRAQLSRKEHQESSWLCSVDALIPIYSVSAGDLFHDLRSHFPRLKEESWFPLTALLSGSHQLLCLCSIYITHNRSEHTWASAQKLWKDGLLVSVAGSESEENDQKPSNPQRQTCVWTNPTQLSGQLTRHIRGITPQQCWCAGELRTSRNTVWQTV